MILKPGICSASAIILWLSLTITCNANGYRLPTSVAPELYDLEIITNLGDDDNNFNFEGKVRITVNCLEATKNITLHSKDLHISSSEISVFEQPSNTSIPIANTTAIVENDFFIINLSKSLEAGKKYLVFIPFDGKLNDGLAGYYRSSYKDKATGEKRWLAVTQMEPISARKALPCFDEPAMKAKFRVSLGRKKKYVGLSNMPVEETVPMAGKEGWEWDRFEESVPMSTYLLAFIVSDFGEHTAPKFKSSNTTFRIWARKDALYQTKFAEEEGPKALDFYERFFDIEYPLPKQDMIAIPDFNAGAMENWGLITYRESLLLFDPQASSTSSKHSVSSVIAHELAHQWFGNLVTMKWWTDLWLNEGFATYMAGLAVHDAHPQWNSLNEEAVNNVLTVFSADSLESSHPVSVPIGNPKMINEIFDAISYKKGSFLIRMMGLFLGEETLRKGVSNYLCAHKYNNAEQDDLWNSLTAEAHENKVLPKNLTVKDIMDTWTLQTGYPVVTVKRNYEKKTAELSQERYLRDTIRKAKNSPSCWIVPLSYTSQQEKDFNSTKPKHWTTCPTTTEELTDMPSENQWVIFNVQLSGLYRVNYDEKNWKLLTEQLNSDDFRDIPALSRVQLLVDSMDLAWIGDVDYKLSFDILKYLRREKEYLPWKGALRGISSIDRMLKTSPTYGTFKAYMNKVLTPIYEDVGGLKLQNATIDRLDVVKHQVLVVARACKYEVANCVTEAEKKFKEWQLSKGAIDKIPKDLKGVVYCSAIKHGGEAEWMFLWNKYLTSNIPTEKSTILSCLAASREVWILNRYLEWSVSEDSSIRKQDTVLIFTSVASTDVGFYVAKDFLENNIKRIYKHLSNNSDRLSRYLSALAGKMTTQEDLDWMIKFTDANKDYLEGAKQGVKQALETISINIQWQNKHLQHITKVLSEYQKK